MINKVAVVLAMGGAIVTSSCTAVAAADFTLTSTNFKDGTMMPQKLANSQVNSPQNPNCVGENISPQLSWSNPPNGTKSFAITMVDPEAGGGGGAIHWVAYGIAPNVAGFDEGETSKPSPKFVGGKNGGGKDTWQGPCAGPGAPHHYTFILIATELDPKELPPGLTRQELLAKLVPPAPAARRVTGTAGLIGLWRKP
jgi:Raf kinase inhibitor-like YbhB/YbcL family protein